MFTEIISTNISTALVFIAVFLLVWRLISRPNGSPPGPPCLPLFGNLLSLRGKDVRCVFQDLRKQYGDIFSVYFGTQLVVVINGFDSIKKAFVRRGEDFSSRPHNYFTDTLNDGMGIINLSSTQAKGQRKFLTGVLREFGFGKHTLETRIHEEIHYFLTELEEQSSVPFDIKESVISSVSNVINSIVWGRRFSNDDPVFKTLLFNSETGKNLITKASIISYIIPFAKWIPGDFIGIKTLQQTREYFHSYANGMIAQHKEDFDENNVRDVIDAYLSEMKKMGPSRQDTLFSERQVVGVIGDLFGAGTETTATTIRWALIFMIRNPDVQWRLQAEIDEVVGRDRLPSQKDRSQLPYTEAFIMELQRISDIVPFSIPYGLDRDITFEGYKLPKGTTVLMNINSVLYDPNLWTNPEEFRPERFLDEHNKLKRPEELMPFSIGRRVCLGESLAKMELYLFLAAMIQRFTFLTPEGEDPPSLDGELEMTRCPKPFKIRAIQRP